MVIRSVNPNQPGKQWQDSVKRLEWESFLGKWFKWLTQLHGVNLNPIRASERIAW